MSIANAIEDFTPSKKSIYDFFSAPKRTVIFFDSSSFEDVLTTEGPLQSTAIEVDVIISETHNATSRVTDNPIEFGSFVSDHIVRNPRKITIEGVVSDTPISLLGSVAGTAFGIIGSGITKAIPGAPGAIALTGIAFAISKREEIQKKVLGTNTGRPSKNIFELFQKIHFEKRLCTVVSGLETYNNVVMESFEPITNKQTGTSLRFKATFKEIDVVFSETGIVPKEAQEPKEEKKKDKGKKEATEASKEVTDNMGITKKALLTGVKFLKSIFQSIIGP